MFFDGWLVNNGDWVFVEVVMVVGDICFVFNGIVYLEVDFEIIY